MAELNLDFNEREIVRYASRLRQIGKAANEAADYLERREEQMFVMNFLMLSMAGSSLLNELGKILVEQINKSDGNDFPEIIESEENL